MAHVEQLMFRELNIPLLEKIAVKAYQVLPYTHGELRPITLKEWESHPFDPQFRRRVGFELVRMSQSGGFTLEEILPDKELDLLMRYFFPNPQGRLVKNQRELIGTHKNPKGVRKFLSWPLGRTVRRFMIGDRAIEVLKPALPVYKKMVYSIDDRLPRPYHRLYTIDQLRDLPPDLLIRLGEFDRHIFEKELLLPMHRFFPDWDPQIEFTRDWLPKR